VAVGEWQVTAGVAGCGVVCGRCEAEWIRIGWGRVGQGRVG
jgi:hypothetical protein